MTDLTPQQRERLRALAGAAMLKALRRLHPEFRWKVVTPDDPKPLLDRRTGT